MEKMSDFDAFILGRFKKGIKKEIEAEFDDIQDMVDEKEKPELMSEEDFDN